MRATGHKTWREYQSLYPREWAEYRSFAVIRNPYSRAVSCYLYARLTASYWHSSVGASAFGKHPDYDICRALTFSEVMEQWADQAIRLEHPGWLPQSHWVCDEGNRVRVNTLIRFEYLVEDLRRQGICESLIQLNRSGNNGWLRHCGSSSTLKLVWKLYERDFQVFYPKITSEVSADAVEGPPTL
jgi:hypothetical protein